MRKMKYLFSNRDLRKLIVPLMLEQALAVTVGMADTMMISSAGEAAVSGVSLVDMINMLMFSILSALSTGGAVVVSQKLGAVKLDEARRSAKQLLFTVLIFSTLLTILLIVFRHGLLNLFFGNIEQDVMEAALIYLVITALSIPFLGIYNSCAALFRSMGRANITFIVSIIGNVINIVGNALCIFVLHMGVAGVAIPSLVSRIVMGVILYILLRNPKYEVYFDKNRFQVDWSIIKKILYIGIPSGVEGGIFHSFLSVFLSLSSAFSVC